MLGLLCPKECIVKILPRPPLLPVHAFFRVFYTETLNCSELFASIKLFGVINKSFNFV